MTNQGPSEGQRHFTWIKPQKKRPTEYENVTVGLQSDPQRWLHVDWPLLFDNGRAPFTAASTALRCQRWEDFRDPSQLWQRPYVARLNREEQTLETLTGEALQGGLAQAMNPIWRDQVIGKYYAAWPFVEYGECLALCYAVREALAETITFAVAFEATDKTRHSQDIVHLLFELQEAFPGFNDAAARPAWLGEPEFLPLRENVERIVALKDWAEILVAINLVLEPLVGELFKTELLAKNAARNGDPVTPMILAGAHRDCRRHLETTQELVRMVMADPIFGSENKKMLQEWLRRWQPLSERAAEALQPVFEIEGISAEPFAPCWDRVCAGQRSITQTIV